MKSILFTIAIFTLGQLQAQTIDNQFSDLMENTETFKEYKVIKISELNGFWSMVTDTLKTRDVAINDLTLKNDKLINQLDKAENDVMNSTVIIDDLNNQISTISVFGLDVDKTLFKIITFSFQVILLATLVFLLIKLRERISTANRKIKDFNSLEVSFEDYKKDALEKQMKLRRELQTERNRIEEIRSTI